MFVSSSESGYKSAIKTDKSDSEETKKSVIVGGTEASTSDSEKTSQTGSVEEIDLFTSSDTGRLGDITRSPLRHDEITELDIFALGGIGQLEIFAPRDNDSTGELDLLRARSEDSCFYDTKVEKGRK